MRTQRRSFPFFLLLFLCLSLVFAALGVWQLYRAEEKSQLQQEVESRLNGPPLASLPQAANAATTRFQPVALSGTLLAHNSLYLDNVVQNRINGYEIFTPLVLNDGRWVLIDRGWVPAIADRKRLPEIPTPNEPVDIRGVLYPPKSKPIMVGALPPPDSDHETRWFYLDTQYLAGKTGKEVYPLVVRLDPDAPYGFDRDWAPFDAKVSMHIGYAIHWFVFSFFVFVCVVVLYRKRVVKQATQEK